MNKKYSALSKNILLFAICGVVPKLLAFVIIPIYTNYLSTADYGVYELIVTTVDLLLPIFAVRIHEAVLKFGLDEKYDPKLVFSAGVKVTLLGTCIVGLCTYLLSYFDLIDNSYLAFFAVLFFVVGNTHIVTRFCRAIDKVTVITIASILNSITMFTCNIVFLVFLGWGLKGFILSTILGYLVCWLICFFGAGLYKYLAFSKSPMLIKKMLIFSFPLVFSALSWWVNNASDRYILMAICGLSVSGIYSVAYKVPSILVVVQDVFVQAWSISAIKEFDKEDSEGFIGGVYSMLQFGMIFAASFLMVLNMPIAKIIYTNDFFEAWKYVPPILISLYFNAISLFYDGLFLAIEKTKSIAIFTGIGALINIILNFVLIYFIGPYGAALSTMLGFGIGYVLRALYGRKHFKIKRNKTRECVVIAILLSQMVLSFLEWMMIPLQIIALVIICCLYKNEFKILLSKVVSRVLKRSINAGNE